jgi:phosphate-selective porin OprO/OprP
MKLRYNKTQALLGVALGALLIGQGSAQADSTTAEIRLLKERLKQLEAKVADQAKKEKALAAQVAPGHPPMVCKDGPCEPVPMPPPVWVSFTNGLKVESFEKDFSFKIGGRMHIDGGVSTQPEGGQSGNVRFRRARLEVEGKAFKHWLYKFQYDFTGTGIAGIRDAYLAFKHPGFAVLPFTKEPIILQVGNMKEAYSLEELTSSNNIDFIERALPTNTFAPQRHIGVAAGTHGDDWSAKVGVYSLSPEDASQTPFAEIPGRPAAFGPSVATGGGNYLDVTGRLTWAPVHTEDALIHIGGSGRYHKPNSATGTTAVGAQTATGADDRVMLLGLNTASEANALRTNLLGTPDLSCGPITFPATAPAVAGRCVGSVVSYGAELALAYGPFAFQGEYFGSHYSRNGGALAVARRATSGAGANSLGGTSLDFNGFYVYGLWYLTGESRAEAYKVSALNSAEFDSIKILNPVNKGGWGAWAVGARYSQVNLNDGGILGGRQEDITVGVNWYPVKGVRFMANWVSVLNLSAPWNRPYLNGTHPNLFVMRAQVNW